MLRRSHEAGAGAVLRLEGAEVPTRTVRAAAVMTPAHRRWPTSRGDSATGGAAWVRRDEFDVIGSIVRADRTGSAVDR